MEMLLAGAFSLLDIIVGLLAFSVVSCSYSSWESVCDAAKATSMQILRKSNFTAVHIFYWCEYFSTTTYIWLEHH